MQVEYKENSMISNLLNFRFSEIRYREQILFIIVFGIIFSLLFTTTDDLVGNSQKALISIAILFFCEGFLKPSPLFSSSFGSTLMWRIMLCIVQFY